MKKLLLPLAAGVGVVLVGAFLVSAQEVPTTAPAPAPTPTAVPTLPPAPGDIDPPRLQPITRFPTGGPYIGEAAALARGRGLTGADKGGVTRWAFGFTTYAVALRWAGSGGGSAYIAPTREYYLFLAQMPAGSFQPFKCTVRIALIDATNGNVTERGCLSNTWPTSFPAGVTER